MKNEELCLPGTDFFLLNSSFFILNLEQHGSRLTPKLAQALAERFATVAFELVGQLVEVLDERWGDHRDILAQQLSGILRLLGLKQLVDEAILRRERLLSDLDRQPPNLGELGDRIGGAGALRGGQ